MSQQPPEKPFFIPAEDLRDLVADSSGCFASDRIVVEGKKVGFLYREEPDFDEDSGWRFLAGDEPDDYMADASHFGIYEVNTIANYDLNIIPLLNSEIGTAFEWDAEEKQFVEVDFDDDDE